MKARYVAGLRIFAVYLIWVEADAPSKHCAAGVQFVRVSRGGLSGFLVGPSLHRC
jgi:hypothetical protein